jgi:hypothetical protein
VAQPVEVVSIFVAAGDRCGTRHHHFEHRVLDAVMVAPIGHRVRKPPAHPKLALRLSHQQQAAIGGLVATVKIDCEFLAADSFCDDLSVIERGCQGSTTAWAASKPTSGLATGKTMERSGKGRRCGGGLGLGTVKHLMFVEIVQHRIEPRLPRFFVRQL